MPEVKFRKRTITKDEEKGIAAYEQNPPVVAVLCGDIHLSAKPPVFRSNESDWYATQAGYLEQLRNLAQEFSAPIVCSGDVFDRWNSSAELINFALKHFPDCYAVPGQHDLPYHAYKDLHRSAFWTLVEAKKITLLRPGVPACTGCVRLHGFPWGSEVRPLADPHDLYVEVAVIHAYIWSKGTGYPSAPKDKRIKSWKPLLQGYDVALFGDNHTPIDYATEQLTIFNPGSFMRRKKDERNHNPSVGLLLSTGGVKRRVLDVCDDVFVGGALREAEDRQATIDFIHDLSSLASDPSLNFAEAVSRYLTDNPVTEGAKKIILEALEKSRDPS